MASASAERILHLVTRQRQPQQTLKVRRPVSSNGIPSPRRIPAGVRDKWSGQSRVYIHPSTAPRSAVNDILQAATTDTIDPRVQESERWQLCRNERAVEAGDQSGERG